MSEKKFTADDFLEEAKVYETLASVTPTGAASRLVALLRQAAEDRKDAERYRWLKENFKENDSGPSRLFIYDAKRDCVRVGSFIYWVPPEEFDAAIDAASHPKTAARTTP